MREPAETPAAPAPRAARPDPLDRVLAKDRGALLRLQKRLAEAKGEARATAQQALEQALARSREAFAAREARLPEPRIDAELPIGREADAIVALIRKHQVVVIAGETGSGKTTQLPKLCLAAGRGAAGLIGCTQPRRIAARAVAKRVAEELQVPLGKEVGWQVRFTEQVGEDTLIKFMTDGILLAEIQKDRYLSAYDTIIVDEAHERSLNIDFLLGYLKGLLRKRRDLKLIVTSATIDTERFAKHFDGAPVISVEGRSYPVEVRYRPLEDTNADVASKPDAEKSLYEACWRPATRSRGKTPAATCWCSCRASARSARCTTCWSAASTARPRCCRCTRGSRPRTRTACSTRGRSGGSCWPRTWPRPR